MYESNYKSHKIALFKGIKKNNLAPISPRRWLKWRFGFFSLDCRSSRHGLAWFSRIEEIFQERVFGTSCRECFCTWVVDSQKVEHENGRTLGSLRETIGVFGVAAVRY